MAKRKSRIRKKSVKKSKSRNNRGKIRNPKTGRYVKKSGVIGKKLLAKSRKKKKTVKKSKTRRLKSVKKSRSRRRGQTPSRGPSLKRDTSIGPKIPRLGLFDVPPENQTSIGPKTPSRGLFDGPSLKRDTSIGPKIPRLGVISKDTNSTTSNKSFTKLK